MQNKRNINSFGITLNRYCMLQHVLGEGGGVLYATSGTLGEEAVKGTICYNRYSGDMYCIRQLN